MAKTSIVRNLYSPKDAAKRPGVHAKTKTSKNKNSDLYKKPSKGQG